MVEVHFENIRSKILAELDQANHKVIVAVYWFTNEELFQKLLGKVDQGLDVEVIIHNDYINNRAAGLPFQSFIDRGGHFYFSDTTNPMHNKFCVVDENVLINGSYNWTYYAESKNRENVLIVREEQEAIQNFVTEFGRLKSLTQKVDKVKTKSEFEVDENNVLRARDYLANDIVYYAKATGRKELVDSAFKIAPDNIEVQKTASALDLTPKRKLKHSIGASLMNDKYLIIVPKGSLIPIAKTKVVVTVEDDQESASGAVLYGEDTIASNNRQIVQMTLHRLPRKPAGQAKMKYHFSIDVNGMLKMRKYSLDNGVSNTVKKDINYLLEEQE